MAALLDGAGDWSDWEAGMRAAPAIHYVWHHCGLLCDDYAASGWKYKKQMINNYVNIDVDIRNKLLINMSLLILRNISIVK